MSNEILLLILTKKNILLPCVMLKIWIIHKTGTFKAFNNGVFLDDGDDDADASYVCSAARDFLSWLTFCWLDRTEFWKFCDPSSSLLLLLLWNLKVFLNIFFVIFRRSLTFTRRASDGPKSSYGTDFVGVGNGLLWPRWFISFFAADVVIAF